jgi:diaminohydroxyphosphoribosylaminopyrimidine deaminase/5-amino-6-(5-phosphoribosylamino)uracil reductase
VLRKAGKRAKGATLYVNLEPCNHFDKTPPCAPAVIRARIARVVCAARDPNPRAKGGVEILRKAGIAVSIGAQEKEARGLNEIFYTFHKKKRPFVSLKFAASLDGKMATYTRDSKWITNESARAYARKLRGLHQAVIVGIGTVLADNPYLTARTKGLDEPFRVVLDPDLKIPLRSRVLKSNKAIIFASVRASAKKKKALERRGVRVIAFPGSRIAPTRVLAELKKLGVTSVLVEGGGEALGSFIDAKLADRVYAFLVPALIGGRSAVTIGGKGAKRFSEALHLKNISVSRFGDNLLVSGSCV